MPGGDLVREAAEELYSCALEEFVERRGALAARARAAGDAAAAKTIAGLRKPTRSAWVLNQFARGAPEVVAELAGLGAEFRAAQRSLDGAAIRDLSVRRRRLVDDLIRQVLSVSGQHAPSASLTEEVTATLGAALADPQIAELLAAGTLVRAAHSDGFGVTGSPDMTVAESPPVMRDGPAGTGTATQARSAAEAADAAARARSEREHRRQEAIAEAEREMAAADQAADAAASAEREQESTVRLLQDQLAAARDDLADARLQVRRALARQRQARQALDRLHK